MRGVPGGRLQQSLHRSGAQALQYGKPDACLHLQRLPTLSTHQSSLYQSEPPQPQGDRQDWQIYQERLPANEHLRLPGVGTMFRLRILVRASKSTALTYPGGFELCGTQETSESARSKSLMSRRPLPQRFDPAILTSWLDPNPETLPPLKWDFGDDASLHDLLTSGKFHVLDLVSNTVVRLLSPARYLTLSYVWGPNPKNVSDYTELCSNIPHGIRHVDFHRAPHDLRRSEPG